MLNYRPTSSNRLFELEQEILKLKQSNVSKLVEAKSNEISKLTDILNYSSGSYKNPYKNRLLALEQELLEVKQKLCARKHQKQQYQEKHVSQEVISMAFDFDEPIELHYNGITIPATVFYKTSEQPYNKAFDVTDADVQMNVDVDKTINNLEKQNQANNSEEKNDANKKPDIIPPVNPQPAKQISQVKSHSIFDKIAENLAYANSFDLGTLSLEQRFDEFDRILDQQHSTAQATNTANTANDFYLNPFLGNGEI